MIPAEKLKPVLANAVIFGTDLTKTPLADRIVRLFTAMLEKGGVRRCLAALKA